MGRSTAQSIVMDEHASSASDRGPNWQIERGKEVIHREAEALQRLANALDASFHAAVEKIVACRGSVILCGIGKAGLIGAKLSATFASTGTPSHFLHPAEAIHGDLGRVRREDVVLLLSFSGETEEVLRILASLQALASSTIAITGSPNSRLAQQVDIVLVLPPLREACTHGLAPSTSTAAMLALGDALSIVASQQKAFTPQDFARFHPGGALGRRLSRVEEMMRPLSECRIARETDSLRTMLVHAAKKGRRSGAVMLTSDDGKLCGIFTDSDLAKLLESHRDNELDLPIQRLMTRQFAAVQAGARLDDAIYILAGRKISELPVVDTDDRPVGMMDITDVVGLFQVDEAKDASTTSPTSLRLFCG